jgi:hypothetical protein
MNAFAAVLIGVFVVIGLLVVAYMIFLWIALANFGSNK